MYSTRWRHLLIKVGSSDLIKANSHYCMIYGWYIKRTSDQVINIGSWRQEREIPSSVKGFRSIPQIHQELVAARFRNRILVVHMSTARKTSNRRNGLRDGVHASKIILVANLELPFHHRYIRQHPSSVTPPVVIQVNSVMEESYGKSLLKRKDMAFIA